MPEPRRLPEIRVRLERVAPGERAVPLVAQIDSVEHDAPGNPLRRDALEDQDDQTY